MQNRKLRALIKHCYENVPYYNLVFKKLKIRPYDVDSVEDLQRLPQLTRRDIRDNFRNLLAAGFPETSLMLTATTGSTGRPLRFFHDTNSVKWINAAVMRSFYWAGYRHFDKIVNFWGLASGHKILPRKPWQRQMAASPFGADAQEMKAILNYMKWFRPKGIRGYATSLYMLAKQNEEINLRFAIASSETLYPHYRRLIEQKFGCSVFDNYSSREFMIAAECDQHSGYHIAAENCVVEFVRDGEQVNSGETGRILVTDLTRYGMPLVRYDMGDLGKPSDEPCPCGRGLPMMRSLEGRVTDILITPSGKFVSPSAMIPFMEVDVEQFQIVKKSQSLLLIRIIKGPTYADKDNEKILDFLKGQIDDMEIEIEFVDSIPLAKSGKSSSMISEV
jgi:phenylacetate-CoA ligase